MEERNNVSDRKYDPCRDNYDDRIQNGSISMDLDRVSSRVMTIGTISMDFDQVSSGTVTLDSD
jgi:hypothetical protein